MRKLIITRPEASEHAPYYSRYVDKVPKGDILQLLKDQMDSTLWMMENLDEAKGDYRYAEGKWTVKEVFGHVNDAERVFAYRAMCISRGDTTPLPGFEQDDYVATGAFNTRPIKHLMAEYQGIRSSTVALLEGLTEEGWKRSGTASDFSVTTKALVWIIAGHELHHLAVLKEKYDVK